MKSKAPLPYGRHPSESLQSIFQGQDFPHQGQRPHKAKVIVVGLDANYSPELAQHRDFFQHILEYHQDGVEFWKKYEVHHPFMLASYPLKKGTGGVPYHRKFQSLGLPSKYSEAVSFIELLPSPTTGSTEPDAFWSMFDERHAHKIDDLIQRGERRLVLLSSTLFSRYMKTAKRRYGVFTWLPKSFSLGNMKSIGETIIFGAPHFSGAITNLQLKELGNQIRVFCDGGDVKCSHV